jgi:Ser/Thr protein kinase RdoA (MazF antagonist)
MSQELAEHPLADRFNQLAPDDVLDAVEVGDRRCTGRFLVLNSYENRVYQLELEDGSWVVGKFYRPGRWSREAILAEHRFLFELREVEVPAVCPVDLGDGLTVGEVKGILFSLFPRVGGRIPQELDEEQVQILGRLVARIHNVGASREAPERPRLTPETYGRDNLRFLLERGAIPDEARDIYVATVEALIDRMTPLFVGVPVHRIHGDCHLGNLIWTPKGPAFLDFDDFLTGPAVQDVWMMVPSADDEGRRQRDRFIEAYEQLRHFETRWLRLVEPLRALRFVHYSTWITRRWHDPYFKRTFQHYGDLQYWQREIQDLREQIARLDEASGA